MIITYTDIGMIIIAFVVIAIGILIGMGGKAKNIDDKSEYDVDYDPRYDRHYDSPMQYHHDSNNERHGNQTT